ncbi:MAG: hypothetical protein H6Q13_2761 [Bacteroidetes bacterium]|nr:hypothetical protein [Bacteroidota bacterium]
MQNEDLLEAAFCSGYEPEDDITWEQLLYEARQWITDLTK